LNLRTADEVRVGYAAVMANAAKVLPQGLRMKARVGIVLGSLAIQPEA
jgi:hypothetical protein